MRLNPSWQAQVGDEALNLLKVFGYRQVWDEESLDRDLLQKQEEGHDFLEDEDDCEEGWATENLVSTDPPWPGQSGCMTPSHSQSPEDRPPPYFVSLNADAISCSDLSIGVALQTVWVMVTSSLRRGFSWRL